MVAEAGHGLGLSAYAYPPGLVEALGLDQGEGHVSFETRVACQMHVFLGALAQPVLQLIAAGEQAVAARLGLSSLARKERGRCARTC